MSYGNNYNSYRSPSGQPGLGQDGPKGNAYPSSTHQHQPQQSVTQNVNSFLRSYNYQALGAVSSSGSTPTDGAQSGFIDGRPSVDAANLRSLAHASSLARGSDSSQQAKFCGITAYESLDSTPSVSTEHKSVDSRDSTASSYVTNSSNAASQSPKLAYQSTLSVGFVQASQILNSKSGGDDPAQRQDEQQKGRSRIQPNGQQQYRPNAPSPSSPSDPHLLNLTEQLAAGNGQAGQTKTSDAPQARHTGDAPSPMQNLLMQINATHQPSNTHAQSHGQRSQQSRPVQERHPTTVDPSQVFDDFEYQRREVKMAKTKAADSALSARISSISVPKGDDHTETARSPPVLTQSSDVLQATRAKIGNSVDANPVSRDQMELEVNQMVEKMRDYRAKDPSLFLQIWEQVKKGQAPQVSTTSSTPPIQAAPVALPATNGPLSSPIQSNLLAESEGSAIALFPPDFDRGRFPLQRRRRGGLQYPSARRTKSPHQGARFSPAGPSEANTLTSTAPLPPAKLVAQMNSNDADQRLYAVMQTNHQNPNPPTHTTTAPSRQQMLPLPPPMPPAAKSTEPTLCKVTTAPATTVNPNSPTGKTVWPENHKRALAEAAAKMLTTIPPNVGKQITADELQILLDQNPSYTQFCAHLDARGFVIDRGHFARALIDVVPGIATRSPSGARSPSSPSQSRAPPMSQNRYDTPYGAPRAPTDREEQPLQDSCTTAIGNTMPGAPQVIMNGAIFGGSNMIMRPIITKEDKARKRTFSDFVDLTQFMSDDEDELSERHHPRLRIDQFTNCTPLALAKNKTGSSTPSSGQGKKQEGSRRTSKTREHILKERVVEPLMAQRDTRRCSSYDSKTIARDILISSGKHPTMAPLNYHLEILRKRFECVNHDSDLSTFRWDIVDPVREPEDVTSQVRPPGVQVAPRILADIMNQDADDDLEDDRGADKASPKPAEKETSSNRHGRPVKHPNPVDNAYPAVSFISEHHFNRTSSIRDECTNEGLGKTFSKPLPVKNDTASSTNKWQQDVNKTRQQLLSLQNPYPTPDLVTLQNRSALINSFASTEVSLTSKTPLRVATPDQLSFSSQPPVRGPCIRCRRQNKMCNGKHPCSRCRIAGISSKGCVITEDETSNIRASSTGPAYSSKRSSSARFATLPSPSPPPALSTPPSRKKETVHGRIGRPPGAKNKAPRRDKGIRRLLKKASSSSTTKPMQPPRPADSTPRRASDLRNATSATDGIAVIIQSRSPRIANSSASHARGRHERTSKIEEPPVYQSYKCGWQDCPSELHNLETLRKHIRKHRKGLGTPLTCLWMDCARDVTYEDETAWNRHVEKKHVKTVAKALGDVLNEDSDEESRHRSTEYEDEGEGLFVAG